MSWIITNYQEVKVDPHCVWVFTFEYDRGIGSVYQTQLNKIQSQKELCSKIGAQAKIGQDKICAVSG